MKKILGLLAVVFTWQTAITQTTNSDTNNLSPVYIVNYDHLGVMLWGEKSISWSLDVEYNRLKKYKNFTTGWDHEAYSYDYLFNNDKLLLKKMQDGIKQFKGRLSVGTSTYGQPLSRFINEESNIRQLTYGVETVQKYFGVRPQVYLMGEHAFHGQLPQLLVGSGFQGSIMRTHFMMFGYNPTINAPVVNWQSPDGTSIPTVPTYKGQEHDAVEARPHPFGDVTLDGVILTDYVRRKKATLQTFRETFGKTIQPLVASRADDPRQPDEIIQAHQNDNNFKWTVAENLFNYLPKPSVTFAPAATTFSVRMPWGYMGNWVWNKCREAEVNLLIAERLAAINFNLGGTSREDELKKSWKNLMVAQHHDVQIVGLEKAAETFLKASLKQSEAIKEEAMKNIGSQAGETDKKRYVVFNPLNWDRTEMVGDRKVVAPALGFLSFPVTNTFTGFGISKFKKEFNTPFYTIGFDDAGNINSIKDKKFGKEYLNGSIQLTAQINGKKETGKTDLDKIELHDGAYEFLIKQKGMIGSVPFSATFTFYTYTNRIDFHCAIEVKDEKIGNLTNIKDDPYSSFENAEKLLLKIFPAIDSNKLVGVQDEPFIITETKSRLLQGNYWTAFSDDNNGIAIFNKGNMATEYMNDGSISVPLAFSTTFIWNTVPMKGKYTYDLAIYPFSGGWKESDLHKKALEYNFPLQVIKVEASGKKSLGNSWSPYAANDKGTIVSALYTDKGKTFIRYYEPNGNNTSIQLHWMNRPVGFIQTNLFGKSISELGGNALLAPYKIATYQIAERNIEKNYKLLVIPEAINFKYENDWTQSKWLKKGGITQADLDKCVIK
jgi:hypothetical protein